MKGRVQNSAKAEWRYGMVQNLEDDELVSALVIGLRTAGAPHRAYGVMKSRGRKWWIGNWSVDPETKRKVQDSRRRALVRIFMKTNGHCHFCGDALDFEKIGRRHANGWERDHIITKRQGGSRQHDNLLPAHWKCNALRWARGFENMKRLMSVGLIAIEEIDRGTSAGRDLKARLGDRRQLNRLRRQRYLQQRLAQVVP
jgi:5-methylcytosine-specific restriction endonuclease McrA